MLKFYFALAPNPMKVALFLEEAGLPYELIRIDTRRGGQHTPEFKALNPNAKTPVIVDGETVVFDSNAILLYLAEKSGRFLPAGLRHRVQAVEWLFWQVGGLGPMVGQNHHFARYAPERIPYAVERYVKETTRLYNVLDRRLADHEYLAGSYSVADMATWPWISRYEWQQIDLTAYPNLMRWYLAIADRLAVNHP